MNGVLAALGARMTVALGGVLGAVEKVTPTNDWSIKNLLEKGGEALNDWARYLMILIGLVMVIVGVYQIAKGLITSGGQRGQTNWVVAILLIIVGGAIGFQGLNGWSWVAGVATGGVTTLDNLAKGAMILLPIL